MSTSILGKRVQRYLKRSKRTKITRPTRTSTRAALSNILRNEVKTLGSSFSTQPDSSGFKFNFIPFPARGATSYERIGNKIHITRITANMDVAPLFPGANESHPCLVRLVLVHDRFARGLTPNAADIFDANAALNALSPYRRDNLGTRFNILWDKSFWKGSCTLTVTNCPIENGVPALRSLHINKKVNIPVTFNDSATGSIIDVQEGALWLLAYGTTSGNHTGIACSFQLTYTDL